MWMDSTTSKQCSAIEEALGGAAHVTALTGSRSLERYTGPQIRKIYETQADIYHETERVSLISSFMASLLVGDYVAIDHSDAAGMTLMDLHQRTWSPDALNHVVYTLTGNSTSVGRKAWALGGPTFSRWTAASLLCGPLQV